MFDTYIQQYGPRLYALCLRLSANLWDAQDLYQETWLRAYRSFARYDPQREFSVWVTQICINLYRDQLRRKKLANFLHLPTGEEQQALLESLPAPEPEDFSDLHAAIQALPPNYRLVILLYYFHDQDIAQAAKTLGLPPGTVKSRLSKARALLKGVLPNE